jgi:signal transduction histidine kinase
MGAELDVQSELGQGAEFTLHLPATSAERRPSVADLVT